MSDSLKKSSKTEAGVKTGEKIPQKSRSAGKTAKQLINKHIQDKNDVISDEDFKNLNIDFEISDDTGQQPLNMPGKSKRPKDEDKDPEIMTPWNTISE